MTAFVVVALLWGNTTGAWTVPRDPRSTGGGRIELTAWCETLLERRRRTDKRPRKPM